jgi:hypothetical protein
MNEWCIRIGLVACIAAPTLAECAKAPACGEFSAPKLEIEQGVSSTLSPDRRTVSLLFSKLQAATGAKGSPHTEQTVGLRLEPAGCSVKVKVDIRGNCQTTGTGEPSPSIAIAWGGSRITRAPKCANGGEGFVIEASMNAKGSADMALSTAVSLEKTDGESLLTIDSLDLSLPRPQRPLASEFH